MKEGNRRKISIRAFRAVDDTESCLDYINGHSSMLESYGVKEVIAGKNEWQHDKDVYIIIVRDSENNLTLGGARIQIKKTGTELPIESALKPFNTNFEVFLEEYTVKGTGEFCGLWNSRAIAGYGIGSMFLVRAGVARAGVVIAEKLNLTTLFAFCASYTVPIAQRAGFEVESSIGTDGTFPYPTEEFKAVVTLNKDIHGLEFADEIEKEEILNLRKNPVQMKVEKGPRGETEVLYDLRI